MADKKEKGTGTPAGFVDRSSAQAIFRKLNEAHGRGVISIAEHRKRRAGVQRISTKSLGLDFGLGGGIPAGYVVKFVGMEQSGKTTLVLMIIGDAQRRCANCMRYVPDMEVQEVVDEVTGEVNYRAFAECDCYREGLYHPVQADGESDTDFKARTKRLTENSFEECRCAFFDVENKLDLLWAETLGVDTRRLALVRPMSAEQAVDIYSEMLYTGLLDVMALDSIAALAPRKEIEMSANDAQQGESARIVNKFVRRIVSESVAIEVAGGRRAPTHLWINQLRQKIGVVFGDGLVEPAGNGQRFSNIIKIKLYSSGWEKRKMFDSLPKEYQISLADTVDIHWNVEKNQTDTAKAEGQFTLCVGGARKGLVDEFNFIAFLAERYGILRKGDKAGVWLLGDQQFARKADAHECMRNPTAQIALRATLLNKMNEEKAQ